MACIASPASLRFGMQPALPQVPSMVFDIEVEDTDLSLSVEQHERVQVMTDKMLHLSQPRTAFESRLLSTVLYAKAASLRRQGTADAHTLAQHLVAQGFRVVIRKAMGGGTGTACFRHLRNEFLVVLPDQLQLPCDCPGNLHEDNCTGWQSWYTTALKADEAGELLVVEPNFRDHFVINDSTPAYQQLVRGLPVEFVGPPSRLRPLVALIASEMQEAFLAQGLERPPWRKASSMLSKWIPEPSKVQDIDPSSAVPITPKLPSETPSSCASPTSHTGVAIQVLCTQPSQPLPRSSMHATDEYMLALRATALSVPPLPSISPCVTSPPARESGMGVTTGHAIVGNRSLLSSCLQRQASCQYPGMVHMFMDKQPGPRRASCDVSSHAARAVRFL